MTPGDRERGLSDGAEVEEGQRLFCLTLCHLTVPLPVPRERAPKEKPTQPALRQARQGPTDEAQMAAAAALARLEQKQPRTRGPTSQESIRNQGERRLCLARGGNSYGTSNFGGSEVSSLWRGYGAERRKGAAVWKAEEGRREPRQGCHRTIRGSPGAGGGGSGRGPPRRGRTRS